MKHQEGAIGLEKVKENTVTGGGGQPGISPVIQGSDTGSPNVQVGVMDDVRRDYKGGGGHPCGVPSSDHGEAVEAADRHRMGDTVSGGSNTGGGDEFGVQVHRMLAGNSGAVGSPTPTSEGLHMGDWIQGGVQEDITAVDTRYDRGNTKEKYGRGTQWGETGTSGEGRGKIRL